MAYTNNNTNSNAGSGFTETSASLQKVTEDLGALKKDVMDLGVQAKTEGKKRIGDAADAVQAKASEIADFKTYISANPTQSVACAFAAGLALSLLLGRR